MKKALIVSLVSLASFTVHAQLKNTKWKGTIQTDNTIDAILDYKSDTLRVSNSADDSHIETMTYAVKDNVITLKKIYGQSACDDTGTGKYKFSIKDNQLSFTQVSDSCNDRIAALNNSKWTKLK